MLRTASVLIVSILVLAAPGHAVAQGFDWYGKPGTRAFLAHCKPSLANQKSRAFRYCATVWNSFKEGYFSGLNVADKTCFIDQAELSNLIGHIEEKGEEYIAETGWLFAMRDFIKTRLDACEAARDRGGAR